MITSQNKIDSIDFSTSNSPNTAVLRDSNGDFSARNVTVNSINTVSTVEEKENILNFNQSALDIIKSVDIMEWNYKNDTDKVYKIGFIAENTHEYLSGVLHNKMDIGNTIGILLKAIKELSDEIERLKNV